MADNSILQGAQITERADNPAGSARVEPLLHIFNFGRVLFQENFPFGQQRP